jgi:CDP-diacylglycerol--glycerol-3-phosphate 3-phosphatidyltransferase
MISKNRKPRIRRKRLQTRQDRILTLANAISISRIIMALPLVYYLEQNNYFMTLVIIGLIVLSDMLDGYVARKADEITNFGKVIDPVADKICLMVVLVYLIFTYQLWFIIFFALLSIRDIFIITVGVYLINENDEVSQSNMAGKWFIAFTVLMMLVFVLNLSFEIRLITYSITMLLMFYSTYQYLRTYLDTFKKLKKI